MRERRERLNQFNLHIDCSNDKVNEEAILTLLKDKVQNLEPRRAKRPVWKAGALYFHSSYENGLVVWHTHLSSFLEYRKIRTSMASLRCPVRNLAMAACSGTF